MKLFFFRLLSLLLQAAMAHWQQCLVVLAHAISLVDCSRKLQTPCFRCNIPDATHHTSCLHCSAAISQARETFKGVASLEATDSLYSQDCIMLTCTPVADSATADSADTWRVITLRISSSYPNEPPSVVVRMSRDAQLAPQVTNSISGVTKGFTVYSQMLLCMHVT